MHRNEILDAVALETCTLSVEELAQCCAVESQWVIARVDAGLLGYATITSATDNASMRFASAELARARRLADLERDMDANPELAALVADLIEEVQRLKQQLRAAGIA